MSDIGVHPITPHAYSGATDPVSGFALEPVTPVNIKNNYRWLYPHNLTVRLQLTVLSDLLNNAIGYIIIRSRNNSIIYYNPTFAINTTAYIDVPAYSQIVIETKYQLVEQSNEAYTINTEGDDFAYTIQLDRVDILDAILTGKGTGSSAFSNDRPVFLTEDSDETDQTYIALEKAVSGHSKYWDGSVDYSWYNPSHTTFYLTEPEQLAGLAYLVNHNIDNFNGKFVSITQNINLNNIFNWQNWNAYPPAYQWTAIDGFQGIFEGHDLQISGIYGDPLFGNISGGEVRNLSIVSSYVTDQYSGILARNTNNAALLNVHIKGASNASALVYSLNSTHVYNCSSDSILNGSGTFGIAYDIYQSLIERSWFRLDANAMVHTIAYSLSGNSNINNSFFIVNNQAMAMLFHISSTGSLLNISSVYSYYTNPSKYEQIDIANIYTTNFYQNVSTPYNTMPVYWGEQASFAFDFGIWTNIENRTLPFLRGNSISPLPRIS